MSQCVPSWDVLDYDVEELTWENGELSMHGLRPPQAPPKALNAAVTGNPTTWDKPPASGTLEFITHQGVSGSYGKELVTAGDTAAKAVTMDASVPCSNLNQKRSMKQLFESGRVGTCGEGFPARVASCGGSVARVPKAQELSGSVSGSATWHGDLGVGFASASMGSPENTNNDEHDLICHRRSQSETRDEDYKTKRMERSSTKRNRAAAVHNQSERKRRDRINQRMKALQKLVPNSSKTDKASVLDEVITYLKQLQTQVQMMNWMKMSSMMMPITMQQQLQMSMMAQMGMSMGMNMDMNTMNIPSIPPFLHPTPFMPMASWDACGGDRLQGAPVKPVTKDAPPVSSSKS